MWKTATLFSGLFWIISFAHAQSNTERYMLQERCGKQAAATFARDYAPGERVGHRMNYENHYSERLNKCFFLEILVVVEKGKFSKQFRLFDLNENREYGSYYESDTTLGFVDCIVRDVRCSSEREWRTLAKPYLED